MRQFEKFNSRHLFSANKIIKGSPLEIYELIIDIHDYYCKSYLPYKIKEKKRLKKINSLDFDDGYNDYNTNDRITNNQETLRILMNNNFKGNDSYSTNSNRFPNNNYNFKNRVNFKENPKNNDNSKEKKKKNSNKKANDNKDKTEIIHKIEVINKNQKTKRNDYYSVNSFDFNYKIFASEEELKDRM